MDKFEKPNAVDEILSIPDCLDIAGAEKIKLTESSGFQAALQGSNNPKKKQAEVYEWHSTKLPESEILSMDRVKDLTTSLLQDVRENMDNPAVSKMSLDEFRAWLIESNKAYEEFFKKCPRMFRMIVSSRNTPSNMKRIMELIEIRRVHQDNKSRSLKDNTAQISDYFRNSGLMRKALPGEEEEAVRTGKGFRGEAVTRDEVEKDLKELE